MTHEALLEALLFSEGKPFTIVEIGKVLNISEEEAREVVQRLQATYASNEASADQRGIVLINNGSEVSLGTHPEAATLIEKMRKEELTGPLTKQAFETLAIIAYGDNSSKPFIDALRGVNAQVTLRNLIERGLIERFADTNDKRTFRYRLTTDCLRYLGASSPHELPEFEITRKALVERGIPQTINTLVQAQENS